MIKDADEIALLRLAAQAADRVVAADRRAVGSSGGPRPTSPREVRERLVAEGHDLGLFAIVGSGPNSASPHHEASDRVIQAGEPIVLDIGGVLGGYGSDITRTLWVTGGDPAKGPDERFRHLFGVLYSAQAAATAAVAPGVACEAIDAPRAPIIDAEGYGEAFFHRTGHGIGLEGHEDPYLVAGNALPLRAGMAFCVEPGIYLAGRVRRPDRGHRRLRPGRPDRAQRGAPRALRRRRLSRARGGACGIIGRRVASDRPANRPRPDDHEPPAPLRRRTDPGRPAWVRRPMSRRRGRGHHHERARQPGPRPAAERAAGRAGRRAAGRPGARLAPAESTGVAGRAAPVDDAPGRPTRPLEPRRRATPDPAVRRRPGPCCRPGTRRGPRRPPHRNLARSRPRQRRAGPRRPEQRPHRPGPRAGASSDRTRARDAVHGAAAPPLHQEPPVRADARAPPPLRDRRRGRRRQPDRPRPRPRLRRPAGARGPAARRAAPGRRGRLRALARPADARRRSASTRCARCPRP